MKRKKHLLSLGIMGIILILATLIQAGDKTLTFEWEYTDPVGQGVTDFNIYKSMAPGTYDHANDLLVSLPFTGESAVYTTDAILTSPDGQAVTWYFVATAVDGQGNESGYSNEVSQLIDFEAPGDVFNFKVEIKVTTP